jgi:hypothetical protein
MSTLELSELLPQLGELAPAVAERWIAASLAQAAALHEHDGWLYPIDPARQEAAERLHDAWRHWADGAEALVRRELRAGSVPRLSADRLHNSARV